MCAQRAQAPATEARCVRWPVSADQEINAGMRLEWRRYRRRAILVVAGLFIAALLWVTTYLRWQAAGDRADWLQCRTMYARATTAAESIAVSAWQPGNEPRRPGHRLTCEQLRLTMERRAT